MRLAGYQQPNTSKPAAAHKIYPYLLGGISIERVNQVWYSDVTYIPMAKGFLYLAMIMDWVSRAVLASRLSNTLGAEFCVGALEHERNRADRAEQRVGGLHAELTEARIDAVTRRRWRRRRGNGSTKKILQRVRHLHIWGDRRGAMFSL